MWVTYVMERRIAGEMGLHHMLASINKARGGSGGPGLGHQLHEIASTRSKTSLTPHASRLTPRLRKDQGPSPSLLAAVSARRQRTSSGSGERDGARRLDFLKPQGSSFVACPLSRRPQCEQWSANEWRSPVTVSCTASRGAALVDASIADEMHPVATEP